MGFGKLRREYYCSDAGGDSLFCDWFERDFYDRPGNFYNSDRHPSMCQNTPARDRLQSPADSPPPVARTQLRIPLHRPASQPACLAGVGFAILVRSRHRRGPLLTDDSGTHRQQCQNPRYYPFSRRRRRRFRSIDRQYLGRPQTPNPGLSVRNGRRGLE